MLRRLLGVLCAVLLILPADGVFAGQFEFSKLLYGWESVWKKIDDKAGAHQWTNQNQGLVAHGGGGIAGLDTTNCYEAMVMNYELGHTVFELDLNLTADNQLVAVHDWSLYAGAKSLEEYKKLKISGAYTPMDLDDIYRFMMLHKDVYIVTDTKSYGYTDDRTALQFRLIYEKALEYDAGLLDRVIPQIYNQKMYGIIKEVYPLKSIIYTLYASPDSDAEVVDFVKDKSDIKVITMGPSRYSEKFGDDLRQYGKLIYFFTLNDLDEVKAYKQHGIHGFYTDFITPAQMSPAAGPIAPLLSQR